MLYLRKQNRLIMVTTTFTTTIPLKTDKDGVIRVSKTRVTLDTIVTAFLEGLTAEEISVQYPVVPLADVYSVIGYYLHQKKKWKHILSAVRNLLHKYADRTKPGLTNLVYVNDY